MRIVVDGYNLIRQSDTLKRIDKLSIEAGRRELIKRLARYARHRGHRITVVFDGWMAGSPTEEREVVGGITVIYSKRGEKADEVIKRLVRQTGEETVVVTSDREVAGAASRAGAVAVPAPSSKRGSTKQGRSKKSTMTPPSTMRTMKSVMTQRKKAPQGESPERRG